VPNTKRRKGEADFILWSCPPKREIELPQEAMVFSMLAAGYCGASPCSRYAGALQGV